MATLEDMEDEKKMNNLPPHEILNAMGFNVNEKGVEINSNDAFFITTALRLAGSTIDIEKIPIEKLKELHIGLAGLVAAWEKKDSAEWKDGNGGSEPKLRANIKAILKTYFHFETK